MLKYVYVDTENVPCESWWHAFKYLTPRDTIIIPWSPHSSPVKLQTMSQIGFPKCKVKFIPVAAGTPNAMDFVLVSVLAQQVASALKSKHVILSKDNGYVPAINYCQWAHKVKVEKSNSWGTYMQEHRDEFVDGKWVI